MHEKTVIMSMPFAEAGWLGGVDVADDCPELRIHGQRRWFFPDCVSYRVQSGVFEVIADAESTAEIYRLLDMQKEMDSAIERKDFDAALATLTRMRQLNPHCRSVREQCIQILMTVERYADAFDETLDALRLDAGNPVYHSLMAHCLNDQDEHGSQKIANDSLMRAVELGSIDPQDYAILGSIALDDDQPLEALNWSAKALQLNPDSPHGRHLRALTLTELERFSEAAIAFEETAAVIPAGHPLIAEQMGLPDPYRFCCDALLEATSDFPWSRVEREIALIEAELGWSVDLVETEPPESYEDAELVIPRDLEWLDARAPGTVRVFISDAPRSQPASVIRCLMEVRQEARHLQRFTGTQSSSAAPLRIRQHLETLVRQQLKRKLPRKLPDDMPEDFIPTMESAVIGLVGSPLDWLITLEVAERHPDLRHPLLSGMAQCSLIHQDVIREMEEGVDEDALTPLTISLTLPFVLANLFFLADHSRGVLDDTWRYRHLPAWPKAVQIYDHFRAYLRLPPKQQRADHLMIEIATIAGFLPSSSPIHTQGAFW